MRCSKDDLKRAGEKAELKRHIARLQPYIDQPEKQGPYRVEADYVLAKRELGRMHIDNHYSAKQGDAPQWDDDDISRAESLINALAEVLQRDSVKNNNIME